MPVVEYAVQGHIATVTLNRPEARNAINPEVAARLADAWRAVRDDQQVRVAVLAATEIGRASCRERVYSSV